MVAAVAQNGISHAGDRRSLEARNFSCDQTVTPVRQCVAEHAGNVG
jgi:hypothetical protein